MADSVTQGAEKLLPKQIRLADGVTPSQAYTTSDVLSCWLWEGNADSTLATPAVYWHPTLGPPNFLIDLQPADTSDLTPGVYTVQVGIERPSTGQSAVLWTGQLEVRPAPASAPPLTVYCTLADLQVELPMISSYQAQFRDETGFEAQRARARADLDELCHRNIRGMAGISSRVYPADWPYRFLVKSPVLTTYLANNYLWITRPLLNHQVLLSISYVFRGQIPANPQLYTKLSTDYAVRAELALRGCTAQIMGPKPDGTGAGTADGLYFAIIDFSSSKVLRA